MTYVCITGNEQSPAALEQRLERVLRSHPRVLCELRLDQLDLTPSAAFGFLARLPAEMAPRLVLTQRLRTSGTIAQGGCGWDILTWQSWWRNVMALRPWYAVDIDWIVLDRLAGDALEWRGKFRARHAFFSLHASLDELAAELPALVASAREYGAGVKIAAPVQGAGDLARMAELTAALADLPIQIAVAIGAAGRAWRWSRLAGDLTYFAADAGRATAAGQDTLSAVLPYLSTRRRPSLYLLLGDNPENRYGEERWNRAFLRRGASAHYINSFSSDAPGAEWRENSLQWMEKAGVAGASVTKPYKLSFPSPTNTLSWKEGSWQTANTDGEAVSEILREYGLSAPATVVIAGGGGAARAVAEGLAAKGFTPKLWVREQGRLGPCPEGVAFVSTWPGEYQEALVEALGNTKGFQVVVDAQFSRADCPLALWSRDVAYVPGARWWRAQARLQDKIWFGPDRLGDAREAVLDLVPSSKSESLRALAIAAAFGVKAEIRDLASNQDTEVFAKALEKMGVALDRDGSLLRLFPPRVLHAPETVLEMEDGATGLRLLAALSAVIETGGRLRLGGSAQLQERPHADLALGTTASWPLEIATGQDLPTVVSLERSSQFATAFLIAGAAAVWRGRPEYCLRLEGEARSESYLQLTLDILRETGLSVEMNAREVRVRPGTKKEKFQFQMQKDASSLAFLEVYARRWGLRSFFDHPSRQGDAVFPRLLDDLQAGKALSLRHTPDLAPPLWAAAALFRLPMEVKDCPQLRHKESDRIALLVEATKALGVEAEERPDGFVVDFRRLRPPRQEIFLRTEGDHRIAMACGLLAVDGLAVAPDRRDCVRKSFPQFWQALALLEEALPG